MRRIVGVAVLVAALGAVPARAEEPFPYVVCAHVPITGATPIPHHESRFGQFYFDYVNAEHGGVDGHPVMFRAFDDRYYPAGARDAAEQCVRGGAHLLLGPYGIDQIVSVARWAERKGLPYLHGSVPRSALDDGEWSAMIGPAHGDLGRGLGALLADGADVSPVFGTVRFDSPFYDEGTEAFADAVVERGYARPLEIPVQKDERQFATVYRELIAAGVTHVNLYVSANVAAAMLRQLPPTYDPVFGSIEPVPPDAVARAAGDVRFIAFHDPGPVYDPADESLPWHDEIEEFLRIFSAYSPETEPVPDDADWNAYLRAKQIHRFLDALDEDLSPGHIRSMFSTYAEDAGAAFPTCALDFAPEPRVGQHAWHAFRLERGAWEQAAFCMTAAGVDLSPPVIVCGASPQLLTGRLRCAIRDPGSGVGAFRIEAVEAATGRAVVREGDAGCRRARRTAVALPAGVYEVEVSAHSCAGVPGASTLHVVSARA